MALAKASGYFKPLEFVAVPWHDAQCPSDIQDLSTNLSIYQTFLYVAWYMAGRQDQRHHQVFGLIAELTIPACGWNAVLRHWGPWSATFRLPLTKQRGRLRNCFRHETAFQPNKQSLCSSESQKCKSILASSTQLLVRIQAWLAQCNAGRPGECRACISH